MSAAAGEAGETIPATSIETPLARVRGLGSAQHGAEHWWQERLTSVTTFLLLVWLAVSLVRLPALDHATLTEWLAAPLGAVPMLLLIASTFRHLQLGLQVIVEDYVHDEGGKLFWIVLIQLASILGAALSAFAVLRIAFGNAG